MSIYIVFCKYSLQFIREGIGRKYFLLYLFYSFQYTKTKHSQYSINKIKRKQVKIVCLFEIKATCKIKTKVGIKYSLVEFGFLSLKQAIFKS